MGDVDGYIVASLDGHAYACIEGVEDFAWTDEQSQAVVLPYEYAAVVTVVYAVAWLEHGAETGHYGVVVDEMLTLAGRARGGC